MKRIAVIFIVVAMLLCACGETSAQGKVGKALGLDLDAAELLGQFDDHGGVHGDGETLITLKTGDISAEVEGKAAWHPLPLDEKLLPYAGEFGDAEEGYWFFLDRHAKATDKYSAADVDNHFSYNFTLAVYDAESGILSYYELDT